MNWTKVRETLLGHWHEWSFPMTRRDRHYPPEWDSHETCACGVERYYSFKRMQAGPIFKRKERTQTWESQIP